MRDDQKPKLELLEKDIADLAYLAEFGKWFLQAQIENGQLSHENLVRAKRSLQDGEEVLHRLKSYAEKKAKYARNKASMAARGK